VFREKCASCEAVNPAAKLTAAPVAAPPPAPSSQLIASLFSAAPKPAAVVPASGASNPFGVPAVAQPAAIPSNPFAALAAKAIQTPVPAPAPAPAVNPFTAHVAVTTAAAPNPFVAAAAAAASQNKPAGFDWGAVKPTIAPTTPAPAPKVVEPEDDGDAEEDDDDDDGEKKEKLAARDYYAHIVPSTATPTVPPGMDPPSAHVSTQLIRPADAILATASGKGGSKKGKVAASSPLPSSPLPSSTHGCVYTWGSGECAQLGHNDEEFNVDHPRILASLTRVPIVRIASGGLHTLGLTSTGHIWSWGNNDDGALGRPGAENCPGRVRGLLNTLPCVSIAAGDSHSLALDAVGRVYAWGTYKGADGYLGFDAVTRNQREPRFMDAVYTQFGPAITLSCGADHSAVVTAGGAAVAWGYGGQGQLGRAVTEVRLRGNRTNAIQLTPHGLVFPTIGGAKNTRCSAAAFTSPVGAKRRRVDVDIYAAKAALEGPVPRPTAIRAFACGYSTFVVVRYPVSVADSTSILGSPQPASAPSTVVERVFACGLNSYGQLGVGNTENTTSLIHVPALDTTLEADGRSNVLSMVGGNQHTILLKADGTVYSMGRGDSGQLGLAEVADRHVSIPVSASTFEPRQIHPSRFLNMAVGQISAATCTSAAVTVDGSAFVWGFGENGQVGNGAFKDENAPFCLVASSHATAPERKRDPAGDMKGTSVVLLSLGGQHAAALSMGGGAAAALPEEATVIVEDPQAEAVDASAVEPDAVDENEVDENDAMGAVEKREESEEEEEAPAAKRART
jgi:regulator of chromosome condensation